MSEWVIAGSGTQCYHPLFCAEYRKSKGSRLKTLQPAYSGASRLPCSGGYIQGKSGVFAPYLLAIMLLLAISYQASACNHPPLHAIMLDPAIKEPPHMDHCLITINDIPTRVVVYAVSILDGTVTVIMPNGDLEDYHSVQEVIAL